MPEGLTVVERWNEANDLRRYGRQGVLATHSRAQQAMATLSRQLLQNCLLLINTRPVERTVTQPRLLEQ